MNKIELVQKIGDEVCEGCNPNADCGEDPNECFRIQNAIRILDKYNKPLKSENHKNPVCNICGKDHFDFECPDREK